MEPERKIEKLLRAYAKKRRGDAGEPLKLDLATRRLLQHEASRRPPKPESEETPLSLWQLFRQQWAFLTGFAILVFLGAALLLPALSAAKHKAQNISAMNDLRQIGSAAQMAAEENNGQLPASLDALTNGLISEKVLHDPASGRPYVYLAGGENLDTLQSNTVLAYSPADKNGRVVLFANGQVATVTGERFAELTNQKFCTRSSTSEFASRTLRKTTVNAPVAAANAVSEAEPAGKLETEKSGATASQSVTLKGFASNGQNLFQNALASTQATPLLQSFQVLQNGKTISIVDRDGSVYRGSWKIANATNISSSTEGRLMPATTPTTEDRKRALAHQREFSALPNYFFRVAGTNRTLKQNVVFTGNVEAFSNATVNAQQSFNIGGSKVGQNNRQTSASRQQWQLSNSRIVGTAVIGQTNRIEVNATPVVPTQPSKRGANGRD